LQTPHALAVATLVGGVGMGVVFACACVHVYALCNNIHLQESFHILHLLTCCVFCASKVFATIAAERRTRNRERRKRRGRRGEG